MTRTSVSLTPAICEKAKAYVEKRQRNEPRFNFSLWVEGLIEEDLRKPQKKTAKRRKP